MKSYAAAAVELLRDTGEHDAKAIVDGVTTDPETAPVSDRDRQLYLLVREITVGRQRISQEHFDRATAAGWSEEALFEALNVCALFHWYNTWVDGSGAGLVTDGCDESGGRIARDGYQKG